MKALHFTPPKAMSSIDVFEPPKPLLVLNLTAQIPITARPTEPSNSYLHPILQKNKIYEKKAEEIKG